MRFPGGSQPSSFYPSWHVVTDVSTVDCHSGCVGLRSPSFKEPRSSREVGGRGKVSMGPVVLCDPRGTAGPSFIGVQGFRVRWGKLD